MPYVSYLSKRPIRKPEDLEGLKVRVVGSPIFIDTFRAPVFGWDPVWIGVMLTVNVAIGQETPPVAVNLYVAANIARLSFDEISRAVWPFVLAMLLALFVITQWPALRRLFPRCSASRRGVESGSRWV